MDSHYFTAYCYEKMKQGLPNVKLKDSERLVNWARVVKSNAEIELMKSAAIISQKGMQTAIDVTLAWDVLPLVLNIFLRILSKKNLFI